MKNLISDQQKDKLKVIFNRSINIAIVVATLTAGFGLGYYAEQLKAKAGQVDEVIVDKEVRIAIDSEDKLIIMNNH